MLLKVLALLGERENEKLCYTARQMTYVPWSFELALASFWSHTVLLLASDEKGTWWKATPWRTRDKWDRCSVILCAEREAKMKRSPHRDAIDLPVQWLSVLPTPPGWKIAARWEENYKSTHVLRRTRLSRSQYFTFEHLPILGAAAASRHTNILCVILGAIWEWSCDGGSTWIS